MNLRFIEFQVVCYFFFFFFFFFCLFRGVFCCCLFSLPLFTSTHGPDDKLRLTGNREEEKEKEKEQCENNQKSENYRSESVKISGSRICLLAGSQLYYSMRVSGVLIVAFPPNRVRPWD